MVGVVGKIRWGRDGETPLEVAITEDDLLTKAVGGVPQALKEACDLLERLVLEEAYEDQGGNLYEGTKKVPRPLEDFIDLLEALGIPEGILPEEEGLLLLEELLAFLETKEGRAKVEALLLEEGWASSVKEARQVRGELERALRAATWRAKKVGWGLLDPIRGERLLWWGKAP